MMGIAQIVKNQIEGGYDVFYNGTQTILHTRPPGLNLSQLKLKCDPNSKYFSTEALKLGITGWEMTEDKPTHFLSIAENITLLEQQLNILIDRDAINYNSLILLGPPGIGKSYTVFKELNKAGIKYVKYNTHSSPKGLYRILHNNRDAFIVFDDVDDIYNEGPSTAILKSALFSAEGECKVQWNLGKPPSDEDELEEEFIFNGKIVSISNMSAGNMNKAVTSRIFTFDMYCTSKQLIEHIMQLIEEDKLILEGLSKIETFECANFMIDYPGYNCNLRVLEKIGIVKKAQPDNWKQLSLKIIMFGF